MNRHGFLEIACIANKVSVADPVANTCEIEKVITSTQADILLLPELCLTGYTCRDLFAQSHLLDRTKELLEEMVAYYALHAITKSLIVVGAPLRHRLGVFNCAIVFNETGPLGVIPKTYLPNYKEFEEKRWFKSGKNISDTIRLLDTDVPFGTDVLFRSDDVIVGVEICEDLWVPIPPSSHQSLAGANVLLNLSASNELVGKAEYRRNLVVQQSARCIAAYAYASSGPSESTTDLVFGKHCLIAENGTLVTESDHTGIKPNFETEITTGVVDIQKLNHDRMNASSFHDDVVREFRFVDFQLSYTSPKFRVNRCPFVPQDEKTRNERCRDIFNLQIAGLAGRLRSLPRINNLAIGVSGGLDSTLALMVLVKTLHLLKCDTSHVKAITMPGFGTTSQTKTNATKLMDALGIEYDTIDISQLCFDIFKAEGIKPFGIETTTLDEFKEALLAVPPENQHDLNFENVQARVRTLLLMSKGFVIGTGDMSELALGWCTYNADHMSMYNPNCSVPKTLVKSLVQYIATQMPVAAAVILKDIVNTVISPELLPPDKDGKIVQSTEDQLGPYELHDFFFYHFQRYGASPAKILYLSELAEFPYDEQLIIKTHQTFITRYFASQFKRSCVPDGAKVGSVSVSPRGDLRIPSDASNKLWLEL